MDAMSLGVSLVAISLLFGKLGPAPLKAAGLLFARGPMTAAIGFLIATLLPLAVLAFVLVGLYGRDPDRSE